MSAPLSDRDIARARAAKRLRDDLELYARECLRIRTKPGEIVPLTLNRSQRFLHEKIEDQLKRTGRVRMLVLKSRQVGISTYIGARFYHKTSHRRGIRTFILTHLDDATDNLFNMVRRFHDSCPPEVRPQTGTASAKELSFSALDSGYKVGTAGSKAIGRSDTIQLFHGSEMAFWPNADEHSAGIGQAIAKLAGTEDIRESTANGIGGAFHAMWKAAERGDSEFECCFIPWYLHEEYQRKAPADWVVPESLENYAALYNLTREQTYWAWLTNRELSVVAGGGPDEFNWKFRQEFPANADEAFQTSGANHFIKPEVVLKARKAKLTGHGPVVLGVDPSRGGHDKMGVVDRQGRVMGGHVCERLTTSRDTRANAGMIVQIVKKLKAKGVPLKKVCIDCTDGNGLYDMVAEVLGDELVMGVMFGEAAYDRDHYANRRAEMADAYRQWFDDPVGVRVPDRDDFQGDACSTSWGPGQTHFRPNGQLVLEPKEKIKERLKVSPDLGFDAAMLTFAIDFSELREDTHEGAAATRLGAAGWLT